ncbi:DUF2809 domain-containing protein [Streptomyces sp. NBC_01268]|uniref:ribosomal maturation YjgA family protein n=1 Tax=unclassified Streptomyces TaxID=2593676 RepID=UPI002E341FCE|nr:DUF2809 domain-containing protein [Streptomyces sp. NBC_01268]
MASAPANPDRATPDPAAPDRAPARPSRTRTRAVAVVAAALTVGAGLGLRAMAAGDVAKYGGDALYTVLLVTLVVAAAPRLSPARAAAIALTASWAVEFLQLGPVPAELSRRSTLARLVLGSTFNTPDLAWYTVGAAAGWLVHFVLRRARRSTRTGAT